MSAPIVVTVVPPDPPEYASEPVSNVTIPPETSTADPREIESLREEVAAGFSSLGTILQSLIGAVEIVGLAVTAEPEQAPAEVEQVPEQPVELAPEPMAEPPAEPKDEPKPEQQRPDTPPKSTHPLSKRLWK